MIDTPRKAQTDIDGKSRDFYIFTIGQYWRDETHTVYLYKVNSADDRDIKNEDIEALFPETCCQHSYDCCGHWYSSYGRIVFSDPSYGHVLVEQEYIKNV